MITTVHGLPFGYDEQGDGLPVVFLHGFPHDRTLWTAQRRALASRTRAIVPDLRGFGESTTRGPYSMDQYADDLAGLLDVLGVREAVVCGLSMGGYVAMAFWRRHATRVRALVLCDTKASPDTDEARGARDEAIALVKSEGVSTLANKQLERMVGATTHAQRPDVVETVRAMMARQPEAGVIGALTALRDRPDSRPTLQAVSVPVLVLVGSEDVLTPPTDAQAMLALLPADTPHRLDVVADAGHAICVERPAAVTFALHEFLATLPFDRE